MSRFRLPRRDPSDRTPDERYLEAHQRALDSPLLPEQLAGLPDDQVGASDRLKAIVERTEARAGEAVMDVIKAVARSAAEDSGPWRD